MEIQIKYKSACLFMLLIFTILMFLSCDDFLNVDEPFDEVNAEMVFTNESTANATVSELYSKLQEEVLINGGLYGLSVLMGMKSDELIYYGNPSDEFGVFYTNKVLPENSIIANIWNSSYKLIYLCNSILEGLESSTNISTSTKNQLYGEALFIRSLVYFHLANLFGDIPYTEITDYEINRILKKTKKEEIYNLIIEDLIESHSKLSPEYISGERVRVNRFGASALLSRVYLYKEDWNSAEIYASEVINNLSLYQLEDDLTKEFLHDSPSAVLQLKQRQGLWTHEASNFIFEYGPPPMFSLNQDFANSFEEGDLRREHWVREISETNQTWYMSNKYKRFDQNGPFVEYSIVFRLSEQLLNRAEARLKLGDLHGSTDDLNKIRSRAGLQNISISDDLNNLLIQERKSELFCEHGHRWFDLKRWRLSESILSPIKPNWSESHLLLPLPQMELELNPNLQPQNPGY